MKISVLTPSLNSGKYLDRAIKSVLAQNYTNFEHIVMDGGSTDDTLSVLKQYDHIIWVSEPDKGQSDAMNKAFKASTGDIIVYLNADDEFAPEAFDAIINKFNNSPKADMVVGNLLCSNAKFDVVKVPSVNYLDLIIYWRDQHPYNPVSYFYKRAVQTRTGDFPVDNHCAIDIWFLLKAYQKFNIVKLKMVLGTFHIDGNNKTSNTDVGMNFHRAIKWHLKHNDPLLLPFFYARLILGKLTGTILLPIHVLPPSVMQTS